MSVLQMLLTHPAARALGWTVVAFLVQGSLVAALLACVLSVLPRDRSHARYVASCGALVLMLALAAGAFVRAYDAQSRVTARGVAALDASAPELSGSLLRATVDPAAAPVTWTASALPPRPRGLSAFEARAWLAAALAGLTPWLAVAWALGVWLLSLRVLVGWWVTRRMRGDPSNVREPELDARLEQLRRRIDVRMAVRVMRSARVHTPVVLGVLRPMVLVPMAGMSGFSSAQLDALLAHELAHVRRHDLLVNLLQNVAETLLFFHPATWWVSGRIRAEREHCCDDLAVAACGDALVYARALATLEERRAGVPITALGANGGRLLDRIVRLVQAPVTPPRAPQWLAAVAGLTAVLTLVSAMGRAPEASRGSGSEPAVAHATKSCNGDGKCAHEAVIDGETGSGTCPNARASESGASDTDADSWSDVGDATAPDAPEAAATEATDVDADAGAPPTPAPAAVPAAPRVEAACPQSADAPTPCPARARGASRNWAPVPPTPMPDDTEQPAPASGATPRVRVTPPAAPTAPTIYRAVTIAMRDAMRESMREARRQVEMQRRAEMMANRLVYRQDSSERTAAVAEAQVVLDQLHDSGVTDDYLHGLRELGRPLTVDDVKSLHDHGVSGDEISRYRSLGSSLAVSDFNSLHDHGVPPEYVAAMRWQSPGLDIASITTLYDHAVRPEYVAALHVAGYRTFSVSDVVMLVDRGVPSVYVSELTALGLRLSAGDFVRLMENGVSVRYVAELRGLGENLDVEQLVQLAQNSITPARVSALAEAGLSHLSVDELVRLTDNGVDSEFVRRALATGHHPSVDDLVRWKQNGEIPR